MRPSDDPLLSDLSSDVKTASDRVLASAEFDANGLSTSDDAQQSIRHSYLDGAAGNEEIESAEGDESSAIERALDQPPLLIVISGPSGVGKDETLKAMKARDHPFHFVVTATTRPRRKGEIEGVDYHFVSVDDFAGMIEQGELLEYAIVYGDYKGIPKQQVRDALASGLDVVLRIDVQGAKTIRRLSKQALLIFMVADSVRELERRLRERKSDPPDRLKLRIANAREELKTVDDFDYVVINKRNQLESTVDMLLAIISAEKHRVHPRGVPRL